MSRSKCKSFGLDTIISGVVEGLGKAIISEVFGHTNENKASVRKDANVIDMQKDDSGCWRMIENE